MTQNSTVTHAQPDGWMGWLPEAGEGTQARRQKTLGGVSRLGGTLSGGAEQ